MPRIPDSPPSPPSPREKVRRKVPVLRREHYTDDTWGPLEPVEVYAWVVGGTVAVHRGISYPEKDDAGFAVTPLACKLRACRVATEADALRIAEVLARFDKAMRSERGPNVVGGLPPWVKVWLLACTESQGWLDPRPFVKGGKG